MQLTLSECMLKLTFKVFGEAGAAELRRLTLTGFLPASPVIVPRNNNNFQLDFLLLSPQSAWFVKRRPGGGRGTANPENGQSLGRRRLNLTLLTVGRLREPSLARLCEDYAARISRYGHDLRVEEIKEEPGGRESALIVQREAERLRARLPKGAYTVALDPAGEEIDSPGLAKRLDRLGLQGISRIAFLVGGPLGLEQSLAASCDWRLSLSRLTFTHEMARMILLEQLYRACTIQRGEPYHK
jgi:23S rRNA (pseudouridine1915-N3)-methyltransferase